MAPVAERMRAMRARRNERGVREVRITAPDTRSALVKSRIAEQCAKLDAKQEEAALAWIEAVSEFGEPEFDAAR